MWRYFYIYYLVCIWFELKVLFISLYSLSYWKDFLFKIILQVIIGSFRFSPYPVYLFPVLVGYRRIHNYFVVGQINYFRRWCWSVVSKYLFYFELLNFSAWNDANIAVNIPLFLIKLSWVFLYWSSMTRLG